MITNRYKRCEGLTHHKSYKSLKFNQIDCLNSNRYIVKGFSSQESEWRWSEGKVAVLNLGLEKTQSAKTIQIDGLV